MGLDKRGRPRIRLEDSPVHRAWDKGFSEVQIIENTEQGKKIARYIAGYCIKKLTTDERIDREYPGRTPEFSISSRAPGIGLGAASSIASRLEQYGISIEGTGAESVNATAPIYMLRVDGKKWPIDRVLRERIIGQLGNDQRTAVAKAVNYSGRSLKIGLQENTQEGQEIIREAAGKAYRSAAIARESKVI